jgi:hypothetical protein
VTKKVGRIAKFPDQVPEPFFFLFVRFGLGLARTHAETLIPPDLLAGGVFLSGHRGRTILDSHLMAGVAPGREPESGGFADVDKAGRGGSRVGSAHFFASALIVSLRRRTRKLRTRNERVRQSSFRLTHARSSGATACFASRRTRVVHAATPLPTLLATREAAGAPRARSSRRAVGPRRQAIPASRTPCRAMTSRSERSSALDRDARLRSDRLVLRKRSPRAP